MYYLLMHKVLTISFVDYNYFFRTFVQSYKIVLAILKIPLEIKQIIMVETAELIDNDFLRQYEIKIDEHLAIIEYSLQERKIFLTKLIVPNGIKDDEFTKKFLEVVFEQIRGRNLSVVPTSPEIAKFVRSNRKYKRMLPVGLRI